ncbi:MAG: alpha/beta hydrolase [Pseudorhodoplanes sp.]
MPLDYEAEYDNRARVPAFAEYLAGWKRDAAAYREEMSRTEGRVELGLSYGASDRQSLDLFFPEDAADAPVAMFIHGGYWRALEPQFFSHLACGLNARGAIVAVPGYDLTPQVCIGDIIGQMRKACLFLWERFTRRILVCGHSAGGHLAACLLATDWKALDPAMPADFVPASTAISGLFDLEPLMHTSMNQDFRLTDERARRWSPLHWPAPRGSILDAVVGGEESSEYLRQSRVMTETWGAQGTQTRCEVVAGANHFSIIAPLADPQSDMVERLSALLARVHPAGQNQ